MLFVLVSRFASLRGGLGGSLGGGRVCSFVAELVWVEVWERTSAVNGTEVEG